MTPFKTINVVTVLLATATSASAQQPARTVTLPLGEYNRLVDLANRPQPASTAAPVGAVLASADLRIRIERETAHGTFALTGDVLRAGVNRIALISGATLIEGTAAGRPLPLAAEGNTHSALLPGPGAFALTLEWGAPLTFTPGRAAFVLPVPQAGTARATIDVPGDQADVHFSAGLVTRRSTANGRTLVDVTLKPGNATEVWWSMRDSAPVAAARDVRTLADVMTLVTLGESDVRMAALIDLTVAQGEPRSVEVRVPAGYEVSSVTGTTLESSEQRDGSIVLTVADPSARRHQFLVAMERPHAGGSFALDTGFVTLPNAQRERGEIGIEGVGTLDLGAAERPPLHRIDVRELNAALQSLARLPILSAFRYQRSPNASIGLAIDVRRFADAGVLAAVANRAVATTLVTSEGRALTEIVLTIQNRAQPFLKVDLPQGATIVSVDVAGQSAKPAVGADGTRVPLLRNGFRPTGAYSVSYVYLHAGTPFAKKGELEMSLPKMDIPVEMLEWEVFVPEKYSVRASDGNVIDRRLFPPVSELEESMYVTGTGSGGVTHESVVRRGEANAKTATAGESVTVTAATPAARADADAAQKAAPPSQNVIDLQRRAAGVLPVRVDVPRAGVSHQFVKPLVVDEAASVNLRYKRR